jgi:succinate dehydrogenase / fumarate reductase iron-sulfur subunit
MSAEKWKVTFLVSRQKGNEPRVYQPFELEVDPDEYVLDGVERIWAFHDRSLTYRHACHHSTCGACGMLVNGVEKLTCITPIRSVTKNGGKIKVEPMRNFPVVSDLVVDMSRFYVDMEDARATQVAPVLEACLPYERKTIESSQPGDAERLVDCIECGLCISACPSALTSSTYVGPAILAAAQQSYSQTGDTSLLHGADSHEGLWGCHSAYECSAVCPSNVDPAWRIMDLRKKTVGHNIRHFFGKKEKASS